MKNKVSDLINRYIIPIKYLFSAGLSFMIDQLIFGILTLIISEGIFIIFFKLIARAISSLINFILNSKVVFKNKSKNAITKYYILVIVQAIISSFSIYILKILITNVPIIFMSIFIDVIIFIANYFIQKELIFK